MSAPKTYLKTNCHIVLYDASCPLCQRQKMLWERLDWYHRFEWRSLNDPDALSLAPGLTRPALENAMHCVSRHGVVYRGARAFRFMALRIPLFTPFALLLWIPGSLWIAEHIYTKISRNRHWLGRWFLRETHPF